MLKRIFIACFITAAIGCGGTYVETPSTDVAESSQEVVAVEMVDEGALPVGKTPVIILAGQSNVTGKGPWAGLTAEEAAPAVGSRIYIKGDGVTCGWAPVRKGLGYTAALTGPELGLAKGWSKPIHIVKYSWGGSTLAKDWRPPSAGGPGPRYKAMRDTVKAAFAKLPGGGYIAGFVWIQGEADAKDEAKAGAYYTNLMALLQDVRWFAQNEHLPVVLAQAHELDGYPYARLVKEAQAKVAADDPDTDMVITQDLTAVSSTNAHFDGPSEYALGQRCAQALEPMLP